MLVRPKYYFKKELREELLQGRTLVYIAKKLDTSSSYVGYLLKGSAPVDDYVIYSLLKIVGVSEDDMQEKKKYFFTLK